VLRDDDAREADFKLAPRVSQKASIEEVFNLRSNTKDVDVEPK